MATFSKGHYEVIAKAIRDEREAALEAINSGDIAKPIGRERILALADLTDRLSSIFANGNERFDSVRFKAACKPVDEQVNGSVRILREVPA